MSNRPGDEIKTIDLPSKAVTAPQIGWSSLFRRSPKHIYRDLAGLGIFLAIFYAVVYFVGGLGGDAEGADVNVSQMTSARLMSDLALSESDFAESVTQLTALVKVDPCNSHAQFRLTVCYLVEYAKVDNRLRQAEWLGNSSDSVIELWQQRLTECESKALAGIEKSRESARYRAPAMLELAKLYGIQRDRTKTIDALKEYLLERRRGRLGLEHFTQFSFLLGDPEFKELVRQDRAGRSGQPMRR